MNREDKVEMVAKNWARSYTEDSDFGAAIEQAYIDGFKKGAEQQYQANGNAVPKKWILDYISRANAKSQKNYDIMLRDYYLYKASVISKMLEEYENRDA